MNERSLLWALRAVIILMAICGIAFDVFLVPLTANGDQINEAAVAVQCVYQVIVSLPCFWILILAWRICDDMKNGRLFTFENSKRVGSASVALLISIVGFLMGKALFYILGWNRELILHLVIAIVGSTFLVMMMALSYYINCAAKLQEESDLTV